LGVSEDFNRWVLWRIENQKDCNEQELIWLRNEGIMVKTRWRQWGRNEGLWCAATERENVVFIVEDKL